MSFRRVEIVSDSERKIDSHLASLVGITVRPLASRCGLVSWFTIRYIVEDGLSMDVGVVDERTYGLDLHPEAVPGVTH